MICSPLSPPILGARSAWRLFTSVLSFLPFLLHAADPFADIVRKTEPLTPEQERLALHLPPGFEIQLVAAEPEIGKPINLAFDAQGRLWLTQSREYPYAAPLDKPGRDMIKVLSDFAPNGRARKVTTFAEGLNIPIGLYPYKDGVIAFSIPNIYFLRDTNADGRADTKDLLLGRFGFDRDVHGLTGAFRRGYDGWLYADHGFNNTSTLTANDGSTIAMNSGNCYRFKLDGSRVEQYSWGQVNPFGLTFDQLGDLWSADCHSSPVYQLLRGAYYPSFGKPHDGLGFGPDICTHSHGSTAIAGIVHYDALDFPSEYRGNTFIGNVMTCRINRDSFIEHGSTRIAKEEPDFLASDDPWFRPVDLQLGPDGAIYVADFYNRIIGHYEVPLDHPGRDRERGRIWRIAYEPRSRRGNEANRSFDLSRASVKELLSELASPNITRRMLAMNQLVDRIGQPAIAPVKTMLRDKKSSPFQRVHSLWVLHRLNGLDEKILSAAAQDQDRAVRAHALRVLSETPVWSPRQDELALAGLRDSDPYAQRAAADALGQHPAFAHIQPLLEARQRVPSEDRQLLHTIRMALRNQLLDEQNLAQLMESPLSEKDSRSLADVALGLKTGRAGSFLSQHLQKYSAEEDRDKLTAYLRHAARYAPESETSQLAALSRSHCAEDLDLQLALFKSIQEGASQGGAAVSPAFHDWGADLAERLLLSVNPPVVALPAIVPNQVNQRQLAAAELAAALRLTNLEPKLAPLLSDQGTDADTRAAAARALVVLKSDVPLSAYGRILSDPSEPMKLREKIAAVLGELNSPEARAILVEALRTAPHGLQTQLALALASNADGAEALLQAVSNGQASARLLQERTIQDRLTAARPANLSDRLDKLTAHLPAASDERQKLIDERRAAFNPAEASVAQGAQVFKQSCAICHSLDGQGALIGPQLDGVGGRGADRLIEDILDPSRNVDRAFRTTLLILKDGDVQSGLVRREEGEMLVLADATGKEISVPKKEVQEKRESEASLMPDNFSETISKEDFNNLIAYLLTKGSKPSTAPR